MSDSYRDPVFDEVLRREILALRAKQRRLSEQQKLADARANPVRIQRKRLQRGRSLKRILGR